LSKSLLKILTRPFPIIESSKEKILLSVFFGLFIFLFLAIFQPFGLDKVVGNKLLYFAGYGLITSFVVLFNGFITMNLFKDFFLPEKWNVWKSFIHNFIMIIPIAVLNWLYAISIETAMDRSFTLLQFVSITFAVGFFPSVFLVFYLEHRLRHKNLQLSKRANQQLESKLLDDSIIEELSFNSQNQPIKILLDDFVCIKSMGNYVTLYFMKERKLKKEIIRVTMKKIEDDFLENKKIIRCHKSYFVNLSKVVTTSGNARALYLHINELDFQIPVSRNFSKDIILGTIL